MESTREPISRTYFANNHRNNQSHRKAQQLCRQVSDTLHYVLHGDGTDELLSSLMVVSVSPAPDTTRLLVVVQSDLPLGTWKPSEVLQVLELHSGRLRTEIAQSINRKKTPQLVFLIGF